VASLTDDQTINFEVQNHSVAGTCIDNEGNQATVVVGPIYIDLTKPTINAARDVGPNANQWNNTQVEVTFTCEDIGGSGIDKCTAPETLGEGAGQSSLGTAVDLAGNSASVTETPINVDLTKPTLTFGIQNPLANGAGWNNSEVDFPFSPGDALSGVDATIPGSSPVVVSDEGEGVTAIVTVSDLAGNSAEFTTPPVNIDTIAPAPPSLPDLIDASDIGSFLDDEITNDDTPTFVDGKAVPDLEPDSTVTLFDGAAGPEIGSGPTDGFGSYEITTNEPPLLPLDEGSHSIIATVTDIAGNESDDSLPLIIHIDVTDPILAVTEDVIEGVFELNATTALGAEVDLAALVLASDDGPGDMTVTCAPDDPLLGDPIYPLGATTPVSCIATDAAGNASENVLFSIIVVVQRINVNINPSALNLNGKGVVPVALLGDDGFAVADVDALTVRFGVTGIEAPPEHGGHLADDLSQLKLHFRYSELDIDLTQPGDTIIELVMTGSLVGSGAPFEGMDTVRLVRNFSPRVIEPAPATLPPGNGTPGQGQGNRGNDNGNSGQGNNGEGRGNAGQENNGNSNGNSWIGNNCISDQVNNRNGNRNFGHSNNRNGNSG